MARNRVFALCFFLTASVLFAACVGSSRSSREDRQVDFRVAAIEGENLEEGCDADTRVTDKYVYRYPSGREVVVRASTQPILELSLDKSMNIRLLDFGEIEEGYGEVIVAKLIPHPRDLEEADKAREAARRCDLLLTIDGDPIGIVRRRTDWTDGIFGGAFASFAEAERVYSRSSAQISREVAPENERIARRNYWRWRGQRDLWDFHCDSWIREKIRVEHPQLYRELSKTPSQNCDVPPDEPSTD